MQKPFQAGFIVSIKSIKQLHNDLKGDGAPYLLTTHVNQDTLENTFSTLRYMGGDNNHPTAANVCERIRLLCLSKNIQLIVKDPSVEYDGEPQFLTSEIMEELNEPFDLSGNCC